MLLADRRRHAAGDGEIADLGVRVEIAEETLEGAVAREPEPRDAVPVALKDAVEDGDGRDALLIQIEIAVQDHG